MFLSVLNSFSSGLVVDEGVVEIVFVELHSFNFWSGFSRFFLVLLLVMAEVVKASSGNAESSDDADDDDDESRTIIIQCLVFTFQSMNKFL